MPRLFIGIKCTDQNYLTILQSELKRKLLKSEVNWVDPNNFHITLKFLGDVEDYRINSILRLLEGVAETYIPVALIPDKLGIFGSTLHPKVIWFGYREDPTLSELQITIEKELIVLGFKSEERKFTPHLTLARVKHIAEGANFIDILKDQKQLVGQQFQVHSFQLIRSVLHKEGPEYQILQEFPLTAKC